MKILGFAGSLRTEAWSKKVIKTTLKLAEELGAETEYLDLKDLDIPLYDADLEPNYPKGPQTFKDKIRAANAILICSPEYNWASPGVLKNAINWASRPYGNSALEGKLVGLMSSSPGRYGGARALIDLRMSLAETGAWVYPPTLSISEANQVFDEKGNIIDERLIESIKDFLISFIATAKKFK